MTHARNNRTRQLVWLWTLRILVPLGGHKKFLDTYGYDEDHISEYLGMKATIDDEQRSEGSFVRNARVELRKLHVKAEARSQNISAIPPQLARNVKDLTKLFGLDDTEARLLVFAVLIRSNRVLYDAADYLCRLNTDNALDAISDILGLSKVQLRASLSSSGRLAETGLITLETNYENLLRHTLKLLSDHFVAGMLREIKNPMELIRDTVKAGHPSALSFDDFTHVQESLNIVRPYLRRALEIRRVGVNIFIHGNPGTGKSQLVRLLAEHAGGALYEVSSEDMTGDPVSGLRRLQSYRAAQSFLTGQRAVILFDETEDVFNDGDGFMGRKSTAQTRKAWMNRMLEENPVPTIWLSNNVSCLDPAFVRRFDFVMELDIPSKRRREAMVNAAFGDLVTSETVSRIASSEDLAPAIITRAASVVKAIRGDLTEAEHGPAVERVIGNTLIAQRHKALPKADACMLPGFYDPGFVNADANLAAMAKGLQHSKSARLCLFGPSGTGKSAFGRWLADQGGQPLHVCKASDLLSPFLGITEQKIAQAFTNAEADGAVLLFDEVDSFLRDRRDAQHSWEVAQVNEMLTQMEAFPGVFIASTNLMDGLDQAALRRFDLKVRFGYLKPVQAWDLFMRQCADLGLAIPPMALRSSLDAITVLTPGDFATVARQHRFRPITHASVLLEALAAECALKEDGSRRTIGFN